MDKIKVIFLDVDGVLNRLGTPQEGRTTTTWNGFIGMEPELVARFNKLVKDTGSQVVLSSTWRLDKNWRANMKANGLDMEFLDRTDDLYDPKSLRRRERGVEIAKWLNEHPEVEKYVIIDDDSDMLPGQTFVHTSFLNGLTEEISEEVKKHLS